MTGKGIAKPDSKGICMLPTSRQSSTAKTHILLLLHIIEDVPLNASAVALVHLTGAVFAADLSVSPREARLRKRIVHSLLVHGNHLATAGAVSALLLLGCVHRILRPELGHPLCLVLGAELGKQDILDESVGQDVLVYVEAEACITEEGVSTDYNEVDKHASRVVLAVGGVGILSLLDSHLEVVNELPWGDSHQGFRHRVDAELLELAAQVHSQVLGGICDHLGDVEVVSQIVEQNAILNDRLLLGRVLHYLHHPVAVDKLHYKADRLGIMRVDCNLCSSCSVYGNLHCNHSQ